MRALLSPIGSRGDVQPLALLGLELKRRGHEVIFGAPPNFAVWIESLGLSFQSVGIDIQAAIEGEYSKARNPFFVAKFFAGLVADQFAGLEPLIDEGADVVVGAGGQIAANSLAERLGVPYVYVAYCPNFLRSNYHPPTFFTQQTLPRFFNWLFWQIYCFAGNRATRGPVNQARESWGLEHLRSIYEYVFEPEHVLLAVDRSIGSFPPDFGSHIQTTGFFFMSDDEELPEELVAFIGDGEPPLYLGFGSAPIEDVAAVDEVLGQVVERTGCRLVLSAGPSALGSTGLPDSCFVAGAVSHEVLFPQMAAIAHHGGAGTTAAAARAGRPQIIIPHSADQYYWAHRLAEVGAGTRPLEFRRLSADRLCERVRAATENASLGDRAREIAAEIGEGDGVARAADRIEEVARVGAR